MMKFWDACFPDSKCQNNSLTIIQGLLYNKWTLSEPSSSCFSKSSIWPLLQGSTSLRNKRMPFKPNFVLLIAAAVIWCSERRKSDVKSIWFKRTTLNPKRWKPELVLSSTLIDCIRLLKSNMSIWTNSRSGMDTKKIIMRPRNWPYSPNSAKSRSKWLVTGLIFLTVSPNKNLFLL